MYPGLHVKCLYFSSLNQPWGQILVKIPNKVLRNFYCGSRFLSCGKTERRTDVAKLIVASGSALQTHSVLDHVNVDSEELYLLTTVIFLAEAMN
jgi:hypothetical protein